MDAKQKDLGYYFTVAISDAFLSWFSWTAVAEAFSKGRLDVSIGLLFVAIASSFGVLRFGFLPSVFIGLNDYFADLAGLVGFPLVALGYARSRAWGGVSLSPNGFGAIFDGEDTPFPSTVFLILMAAATVLREAGSAQAKELYQTLLNVITMGLLIYGEGFTDQGYPNNPLACVAVLMFVLTGPVSP